MARGVSVQNYSNEGTDTSAALWGGAWEGKHVRFHMAVVAILTNKRSANDEHLLALLLVCLFSPRFTGSTF